MTAAMYGPIPADESEIREIISRALSRQMRNLTREDREDTEQEAMTRLFRVRTEIEPQNWRNYVYATAVSAANDFKRKARKRVSTVGLEVVLETAIAPAVPDRWDVEDLSGRIGAEKDAERFSQFVLLAEQGFNQAEIALRLGMSHSTFRTWKWRLMKKLSRAG